MSLIQWPFERNEYPGVGNPRFVSDIVAANQATIDAMKAITGLSDIDFAIISGLDFTPGTPNGTYSTGIFYLNGMFYYMGASFSEGLYLAANPTDIIPKPDSNGNSILIYKLFSGISTSNSVGSSPIFSGDMNAYRIGLKSMKANLISVQASITLLGQAAFANIGNTAGTVAAGDDPRFGYTQGQIDNLFARKADVILKSAGTVYTPTQAYDPATKLYADSAAGVKLLWLGNVFADGSVVKISGSLTLTGAPVGTGHVRLSHNFGSSAFFVTAIGIDDAAVFVSPRSYIKTAGNENSQFDVYTSNDGTADNATIQLQMWQYF